MARMINLLLLLGCVALGSPAWAEDATPSASRETFEAPRAVIKKRTTHKRNPYSPKAFLQKKAAGKSTIGAVAAEKIKSERDGTLTAAAVSKNSTSKVTQAVECKAVEQTVPCAYGSENCRQQTSHPKTGQSDEKTADNGDTEPWGQDLTKALVAFIKDNCRPAKHKEKKVDVQVGVSVTKSNDPKAVQEAGLDIGKQVGASVGVRTKF